MLSLLVSLQDRKKRLEAEMKDWYRSHKEVEAVRRKDERRARMVEAVERRLNLTPASQSQNREW